MPYKERPIEKLYFSIGEVADELGVNTSQIRYWEKEFGMLRPRRDSKGDRKFTQDDIRKLRLVHYLLKQRGFTIQGAREHLRNDPDKVETMGELGDRLRRMRDLLVQLRSTLDGPEP